MNEIPWYFSPMPLHFTGASPSYITLPTRTCPANGWQTFKRLSEDGLIGGVARDPAGQRRQSGAQVLRRLTMRPSAGPTTAGWRIKLMLGASGSAALP
jgi:hypothetical protein